MAISTLYIYRDRHDTNLKNSRFTEVNKPNEKYLGVLDINVLFFQKISHKLKIKFRNADADADANADADAELPMSRFPNGL